MSSPTISSIRQALNKHKGQPIRLHALRERNRILRTEGILEGVYAQLFTVRVQEEGYFTRYSFTYREILTKHVRICPLPPASPK